MTRIRLGLCGVSMGFDAYVREFPVLEVQQTFYRPPSDATLARWRGQAPPGFEFTMKVWQVVTHEASSPTYRRLGRTLDPVERTEVGGFQLSPLVLTAWQRSIECCRILGASAMLLQCPRSFTPTDANLDRMATFLRSVERPAGVRLLWEPRGPWPADVVLEMCQSLDLVHVVDPFVDRTVTPEAPYYRLHGLSGARHVYSDRELRDLLAMVPDVAGPAYVLFNNIPRITDARRFRALVDASTEHAFDAPAA